MKNDTVQGFVKNERQFNDYEFWTFEMRVIASSWGWGMRGVNIIQGFANVIECILKILVIYLDRNKNLWTVREEK